MLPEKNIYYDIDFFEDESAIHHRRPDCDNYNICLNNAAKINKGINCEKCKEYKKGNRYYYVGD